MPPTPTTKTLELGGRTLTLETGRLAQQAGGAVLVRYGDTVVLTTATAASAPREGIDFFPLTIDYEEKMYAAGKIPGGFIKREGRPSESAILAARLTDRPLRPLFPKGFRNEVQVVSTVLSADQDNLPDTLSIIGASAALTISDIPFNGPVAAVRIGEINGELVVNPTAHQLQDSTLDMVVAGTADAVMMVEGDAKEIAEERFLEAVALAHEQIKRILPLQHELEQECGKDKMSVTAPAEHTELKQQMRQFVGDRLREALFNPDKSARSRATDALKEEVLAHFKQASDGETEPAWTTKDVGSVFDSLVKEMVRQTILDQGERPDGRGTSEIREIWAQVDVLPRPHGSAIFTRGQTQVVSVTTLGATSETQMLDGLGIEESKRYLHHYNFPPYSVGEVRFMRGPSRRDIGHGALAERALLAVLPSKEDFPYTMRVVSEVVSSNGSTSMASVCGSTLSLMDAGVPIAKPVGGIAMGLVTDKESGKFTILSDIQGMEDALGDMDFKVAGTRDGVTAIQMDIKVQGITLEIMRQALEQARQGRLFIIDKMMETIQQPRGEMSPYAPRIIRIKINPQKIGEVIGPGGKTIRGIQEATGAKIDIEDDGSVYISAANGEAARRATDIIERMTHEPEVGEIFSGRVKTIIPSGAFVEIIPGKDGFVHISELEPHRVEAVEDVVQIGQEVNVVVTGIRPDGKINLSRKALLTGEMPEPGSQPSRENRGGGSGRGHSGGGRGGERGGFGGERRGGRPGGGQFNRGHEREHERGESRPQPQPQPQAQSQPQSPSPASNDGGERQERAEQGEGLMRRPRDSRTLPGQGGERE
ncbi:MAG TPA: polyribonucleotide nucleotidyltransferase [Thermomicrobiaceae bacterium]|nr:polyribonucleotide nucleotidyltransferase [Thermomicrobiaceae bacterium]